MIAEKQTKSNIGVGGGFAISIVGRVLVSQAVNPPNTPLHLLGIVLSLAGSALFIWGCVNYAQGKGYSPWLGLLGLLSCIGLIVLVILPDKMKEGAFPGYMPGGYQPPQPGVWPPPPGSGTPPSSTPPPYSSPPYGQPPIGQPPIGDPPPPRKTLGGDDL